MQVSVNDVRKKYLDFFAAKKHAIIPSAPLVPENDPTTLFTGSGMQPMISYLLGQKHPNGTRIADSQKCLRVQDIDDIGDNRHTTFFEMLGNWSLGDYFKKEQIPWMFEFLTDTTSGLGLDPNRIYVTIFAGNDEIGIPKDTESADLWKQAFVTKHIDAKVVDDSEQNGMQDGRIFSYNEKKNWWSRAGVPENMPIGEPGGPDTEMFWDFDPQNNLQLHENSEYKNIPCHVNCDCGRFMEIGNNVFMQYIKTDSGFEELPQRNVDFGGGLERLTAAVNDNSDVFMIDAFKKLRELIEKASSKKYGQEFKHTKSFRILMDHLRAITFLLGDDTKVAPSNTDQGYVLRRLLRRAILACRELEIPIPQSKVLLNGHLALIKEYQQAYPKLLKNEEWAQKILKEEVDKFDVAIGRGMSEFHRIIKGRNSSHHLTGKEIFYLYESFGLPIEITLELAQKTGLIVDGKDKNEAESLLTKHQEESRESSKGKFKGGLADHSDMSVKYHTATHLLHKALKIVLGDHVQQKGSNITPERLRFDFSHPDKMTPEQIKQTEDLVNEQINKDMTVTREEMSVAQAKEKGALGLFEHKYGDTVSVYTMGDFSCEICGGPHVEHTGVLGKFKITKEESASAGVRRIKAILE